MNRKFSVGIDLGTTNSVLAWGELTDQPDRAGVQVLPVPQFVAQATIEERQALPSFLYLATPEEIASGVWKMPEADSDCREYAAGHVARSQSADQPTRTVAAAKSWLANSAVDRRAAILPWNAPEAVSKISPVEASRRYLEHLVGAWDHRFPDAPLREQQVTLTVPASFDDRARDLTLEAAAAAGLPADLVLLEEPQAAVYAWLAAAGDRWRKALRPGDTLLVCDVGGGTTDFTLIEVEDAAGELSLRRKAVGNHILVGGDNMDVALAHMAQGLFSEKGVQVDAWQSVALWHACRAAKETLFSNDPPESCPVTVLGRGSKLIGGAISTELPREKVERVLLDGFLGSCGIQDRPKRGRASGFKEIGLPFESEPSITKHLARFLSRNGTESGPAMPTRLLFNGGVFKAARVRDRLKQVIGSWFDGQPAPEPLEGGDDYDFSVAKGAAYYGMAKTGGAIRIRGGVARSYYIGIESAAPAIPGVETPMRARCIVPFGMEEGTEIDVPGNGIGLVVGEPVQFRFFSSTTRQNDPVGLTFDMRPDSDLEETDSLETVLAPRAAGDGSAGGSGAAKGADADKHGDDADGQGEDFVPVTFKSRVTELGQLELWCSSTRSDDQWKLEFRVRDSEDV